MAKKVLVVDDEPGIRTVLFALLKDEGYEVVTADDGRRALELLPNEHPDLVIMDIMMPDLDGREVVRRMSQDPRLAWTPVILMSAAYREREQVRGAPSAAFLAKPFDLDKLLGLVNGMLA